MSLWAVHVLACRSVAKEYREDAAQHEVENVEEHRIRIHPGGRLPMPPYPPVFQAVCAKLRAIDRQPSL